MLNFCAFLAGRPSTKEYFLPQRGRKSHREQPNVAAVDALVDQLKKGVVEAPQSFYSDLDAIAAQWDSKREVGQIYILAGFCCMSDCYLW